MKTFKNILDESKEAISKSIAAGVYERVFVNSMLCDPDGSFQCHMSVQYAKGSLKDFWWYKELKFLEWNENAWKKTSERLIKDGAIKKFSPKPIKELIEDISDFTVNGHSVMKFRGYYIDPFLKSKKVSEKMIQKFGKYWESIT